MNSNSPVLRKYQERFILPGWFVGAFAIAVCIIAYGLFPNESIRESALNLTKPEEITQFYLMQLNAREPENVKVKIALIEQAIGLKEWDFAESNIRILANDPQQADQVTRLKFIFAYDQAFQIPKGKAREAALKPLKANLPKLLALKLTVPEYKKLGNIGLMLGSPQLALQFYEKVISISGDQPPAFYMEISNVALQSSQYKEAAQFAEKAANRESLMELKRQYTIAALRAYQAGNLFNEGAALLMQCDDALLNNKLMLIFATNYALNINRPDLAEKFIKRALLSQWSGLK